jgi:Ni,Fe-hydrogenase III large subunit
MSSAIARVFSIDELPRMSPLEWRENLDRALRAGAHLFTMYGRASETAPDDVVLTAVLEDTAADLSVMRTVVERQRGYHGLTAELTAMHCFEREVHEQHRVRIAGHPWLKPIRFEDAGPAGRDAYPFYAVGGKEVHEVAVGPVHAGVIEPGSFRFMCLGEEVHHLEIHLGYQHRGVEKLLLQRDPRTLTPLVETIAGDSSVAHAWSYCAALEALAAIEVGREIDAARAVMLELERIAMHLSGLAGLATDVGFLQGASTYGRLRTTAINASMRLCGSRFGRGAIRPAGLGASLEPKPVLQDVAASVYKLAQLKRDLALIAKDVAIIDDCFFGARTVRHRLQGAGAVSSELASKIGLVGMAARASGIARDVRSASGGIYREHEIRPHTESDGDCWARARLRAVEIGRSLAWIDAVLEAYPRWQPVRQPVGALAPRRLAIAVVEGWRGEVVHALETDGGGALLHYKVQDPSLRNWLGLALAVRGGEISDFPICNKSFDLSYCGNDL